MQRRLRARAGGGGGRLCCVRCSLGPRGSVGGGLLAAGRRGVGSAAGARSGGAGAGCIGAQAKSSPCGCGCGAGDAGQAAAGRGGVGVASGGGDIGGPVDEAGMDRLGMAGRHQVATRDWPVYLLARRPERFRLGSVGRGRWRCCRRLAGLSVDHHCDDVVADLQPIAILEPVGRLDAMLPAIDVGAVGRDVA